MLKEYKNNKNKINPQDNLLPTTFEQLIKKYNLGGNSEENYLGYLVQEINNSKVLEAFDITKDNNGRYNIIVNEKSILDYEIIGTTSPIITLNSDNPQYVNIGSTYHEYGASAKDKFDNSITVNINSSSVNTDVVGTYKVIYTATDRYSETTKVERTVYVIETTKPTINLNGSNEITIEAGTAYIDAGATANDNYDGDITDKIVVENPVNANEVGDYTIIYNVQDSSGNEAQEVTRIVHVVDTTAPTITINGYSEMYLIINEKYVEQGITIKDLSPNATWKVLSGFVNTTVVGEYKIVYEATDMYGNKSTAIRTVNVINDLPIITVSKFGGTQTSELESGYYNTYIQLLWETNDGAIVKLSKDGAEPIEIASGITLHDGTYILQIISNIKTKTVEFIVDTIVPTVSGVEIFGEYNIGHVFNWTEGILTLTCNDEVLYIDSEALSYTLNKAGEYVLTITDKAGNGDEIFFTVL